MIIDNINIRFGTKQLFELVHKMKIDNSLIYNCVQLEISNKNATQLYKFQYHSITTYVLVCQNTKIVLLTTESYNIKL